MKHKKLSSIHYLTMNISGLDEDSLVDGSLGCTTYSETTSIVAISIDGDNGNDGGGLRWSPTGCTNDHNSLGQKQCPGA
jgi:hypothetical protein